MLMAAMLPGTPRTYPARVLARLLLVALLAVAGVALLSVGVLGWRGLLPRNRVAGVRTPASLRSDAAFRAANRVAAPPIVAAGVVCATGGALCFAATGAVLAVVAGITGASTLLLVVAGGVLGNRAAEAVHDGRSCAGCPATGCGWTPQRGREGHPHGLRRSAGALDGDSNAASSGQGVTSPSCPHRP